MPPTTPSTTVPIVLATIGICLSLLAVGWNAISFYLAGSRVRVEMKLGYLYPDRSILSWPIGAKQDPTAEFRLWNQQSAEPLRAFVVQLFVRNRGRVPVTISAALLRQRRHALSSCLVPPGATFLPYRLEPGDVCQIVQPWAPFCNVFDLSTGPKIRGEVQLGSGSVARSRRPVRKGGSTFWVLSAWWHPGPIVGYPGAPLVGPDLAERLFTEALGYVDRYSDDCLWHAAAAAKDVLVSHRGRPDLARDRRETTEEIGFRFWLEADEMLNQHHRCTPLPGVQQSSE